MLKIKTNLRMVATIVACLAVATMFASCEDDMGDEPEENGNENGDNIGKFRY